MRKRFKLSKKNSRRKFKKSVNKVNSRNRGRPMRGGGRT